MHGSTASFISEEGKRWKQRGCSSVPLSPSLLPSFGEEESEKREFAARAKRRATSYAVLSLDGNRRIVLPYFIKVLVRAKLAINFPLESVSLLLFAWNM